MLATRQQFAARAHVLARRGEVDAAEDAARRAVRLSEDSDEISQRGDAHVELATVLDRAGRADEAAAALREAIALYERKGNIVAAGRAEVMLESLEQRARAADV
jgi:tetratricopeptide (TPR) repeat protein